MAGGKGGSETSEPCQGYVWLSFMLFFVLSQFLNGLITLKQTNYICGFNKANIPYFFKNILTGQKQDVTELKLLWSVNIPGYGPKIILRKLQNRGT